MKYIIRDRQFACRYFADGAEFDSKKEILDQLASYHNTDFEDEIYKDIYEYLAQFKNDEERLNEILAFGSWEIEEVK